VQLEDVQILHCGVEKTHGVKIWKTWMRKMKCRCVERLATHHTAIGEVRVKPRAVEFESVATTARYCR
jgi:hypothetical protein